MRTMLGRLLVLLITLSVVYFGVGLLVVLWMTSPRRRSPEATPASVGLGYREVEFLSTDGVRLSAWWVPVEGSSLAAVLVPGWGGYKFDEHLLQTLPVYHDAGYSVLLLDLRVQGSSRRARRARLVTAARLQAGPDRASRLVDGGRNGLARGSGDGCSRSRRGGCIRGSPNPSKGRDSRVRTLREATSAGDPARGEALPRLRPLVRGTEKGCREALG